MDDYCYAKMATSAKREHERESAPPTSSKSPTEIKIKTAAEAIDGATEDFTTMIGAVGGPETEEVNQTAVRTAARRRTALWLSTTPRPPSEST
ncbi:uncharacterized protein LOC133632332 isoform X2 [Entelurus aequoreus]|uniref:uncharacterized protein LOC133632332 isoform X2 n=1 Tax=Entelurus aequoreus TaxID=161455 RepID=UPI002B1D1982|nr:uncharacterized protein LOC133632332 isoform X2 [Entelurus aequoreus]